jgi:hypothetical protein
MADALTVLSPVQKGSIWRVRITWPKGLVRHFGKFTSEKQASDWITDRPWLAKRPTIAEPRPADLPVPPRHTPKYRQALRLQHVVAAIVVTVVGFSSSSARSDQYPVLNVAPICHALTDRSDLQLGIRDVSFDECMKAEQADRATMINEWSTFSADDSRHCAAEATMGGESSYTDLLTCLEMARDVRKLHGEADSASAPGSAPPPAPGRRQPTSSFAPRPTQVPGEGEGIEQNLLRRPAVTVRERGAFPVCGRFACTEPLLGTGRTEPLHRPHYNRYRCPC